MQADDLLAAVFPDAAACQENIEGDIQLPNHPLVREVMKDVLTEAMDIDGLKEVLSRIADGRIQCLAVDTPVPSPFSHEILNANPYAYLDDAPLEERRARAVQLRRVLPEAVLSEVGALDQDALTEVTEQAWPDVRDADECHDALLTLIALPQKDAEPWAEWLASLRAEGRAGRAAASGRTWWVAAERAAAFAATIPDATWLDSLPALAAPLVNRTDALQSLVQGWTQHIGPTSASELGDRIGIDASDLHEALLRLEATGAILRGTFRRTSKFELRRSKLIRRQSPASRPRLWAR
jgi:ATP-dependent Lhr-like helicase